MDQHVHGIACKVAAFDQRRLRTGGNQRLGGRIHSSDVARLDAGQQFCFFQIRGDQEGMREQSGRQDLDGVRLKQARAMLADGNRIDNQRALEPSGDIAYRFDDLAIAQRSGFHGRRWHVFQDGQDLFSQQIGRDAFDAPHADAVLDGEQSDASLAVDAKLMKSFEVGLDSGAAARIGSGNTQRNRMAHGPLFDLG